MAAYNVLRGCVINGATHKAGDSVDIDDAAAMSLIQSGQVIAAAVMSRDVTKSSDAKPKKKATKKAD